MKKLSFKAITIALSLTLTTVNCSSSNDDDNTSTNQQPTTTQYFHPPVWIQGTWKYAPFGVPMDSQLTLKFTDSDIISISSGGTQTSWTEKIKVSPNGGNVDEATTNTEYNVTIKYNSTGVTDFFEFKKISDTEIQYRQAPVLNWTSLVKD
ncbi:hypothetical protein P2W68_06850 [Chryseobacterium arthrosphaerae]|uniref:hypothetical protein n=1 Tax=Chryseobacterium arthrosphaerae TaxID=651561 RepID=UPI0023E1159B|nr:hypothetical protein [Chryseobacterium arthrosphaerae]WES99328.1 hypothetical protein P2W68_06850 [Chryseobacterium arthrosphaerae]